MFPSNILIKEGKSIDVTNRPEAPVMLDIIRKYNSVEGMTYHHIIPIRFLMLIDSMIQTTCTSELNFPDGKKLVEAFQYLHAPYTIINGYLNEKRNRWQSIKYKIEKFRIFETGGIVYGI